MAVVTEERIQDIFSSSRWQEHFFALSQALGFSLGLYSDRYSPLLPLAGKPPFCRSMMEAGGSMGECETGCRERAMRALTSAMPRWYACSARVMSFALPVSYRGERAVIVGQGSFPSFEDYCVYLDMLRTCAPDATFPVAAALRFTTEQDARSACQLVDRSVNLLLRNTEEAIALEKKVLNFREIMNSWWGADGLDAGLLRENLVRNLMAIIDIRQAAVLVIDRERGRYVAAHQAGVTGLTDAALELETNGPVVRSLQNGQSFVMRADLAARHGAVGRSDAVAHYYFPIWARGVMDNVLMVRSGLLTEQDLQTIVALCRQVGLIIDNGQRQDDLSRKYSRIVAITELSREITTISSPEMLLRSILRQSAKLLMAEQGSLMLLDQETDALQLEARMGNPGGAKEKSRIRKGEGIAGRVAENGEPILVENVETDPRVRQKNRENYRTRSFLSVPLKIGGRTIGVLNLADKTTGEVFNRDDLHLIQSFATHAAVVLERNALFTQAEQLKKLSITDPLTGLLNRRYFQERLEEEVARSQRHHRPMSLLMLDVDGFKRFNDTFGHPAGDRALRLVGESLQRCVRHMDSIARLGGDEFVVILPETDTALAAHIAERIRQEISSIGLQDQEREPNGAKAITISIGIASYQDRADTTEELLERADQALYQAKAGGRNRIEVYG
jgi:diguanylate cyclase (GGDEF)-like protein